MAKTVVPDADALHLAGICAEDETITLVVTAVRATACCPLCGHLSARVHSRYRRTVADLPWQGLAVRLNLQVRRWFYPNPACARQIFAERLPAVVAPYARRTARLASVVEGGARLLATLGTPLSADTLLTAIRRATRPAPLAPRVIGIDDWSWRRGHRFGTIIVDLERHAVVDLLPDRAVDSAAAWLKEHPQITTIARDCGGVYAEAAAQGAPQATQVADRWHLLHNLAEVLEEFLLHKRAVLREAATSTEAAEPCNTSAPGPLPRIARATARSGPRRPAGSAMRGSSSSTRRSAAYTPPVPTWSTLPGASARAAGRSTGTATCPSRPRRSVRTARAGSGS